MQKRFVIIILVVLMRYNTVAQNAYTDSLVTVINKAADDSNKVKAYHILASLTMGTDAPAAIAYGKKGIALGKKVGYTNGVANCYLNVAYFYGISGNMKSGLVYIDSAITWYKKIGKPDRLAMSHQIRADYEMKLGRLKQSLRDCDTASTYAEQLSKTLTVYGLIYRTIGTVYYLQNDYQQSKTYFERAYEAFARRDDSLSMASVLNKLGNIYERQKKYDESISSYEKALAMNTVNNYENNFSEYYTNLSNVWLKKGDKKKAEENALKAVAYARKQKNNLQLAAAEKMLSTIYLKTDSTTAAIKAASESFTLATGINAQDQQQTSADALAEGYYKAGDYKKAYAYLQISKRLNDSIAREKYDNELAAMQTDFKINEKDKEILLLNKDKKLQQQEFIQQRYLLIGAVVIAILSLTGIWLFRNRNSLRQQMKELELRNQIAADLHDEVGSSLSSLHMLSGMAKQQDNETKRSAILATMSNNAKETMDKMGDIVWMIKPGETEAGGLKERMERFMYEICSSKNIKVSMQLDDLEKVKLSMAQRKNIYLIFKEALNNAVKYSGTEKMEILAGLQSKALVLQIKDFGKGFDSNVVKRGNGINNMHHRAGELGAVLSIDSATGEGALLKLSMPV